MSGVSITAKLQLLLHVPITCLYRWLEDIFFTGCRRDLQQSDLYAHPSEVDSQELLKQFNRSGCQLVENRRLLWVKFLVTG